MANTYTQIHIHTIFAVQNRQSLIRNDWCDDLYKYITGIVQNHNHKVLQINGMPDHVHLLLGFRPTQSLSELMKYVKQDSTKWINQNAFVNGRFSWQEGYGAFSHSRAQVPQVVKYIQNQEEHHKKRSFREEYLDLLEKFEVDYDERFIFKPVT
ncbi:IS200/IS605 family transposase [Rhodohalobacter sp.]|uniref:IS200/IS605 family transposase n=1 Tax=Rhodohalobacter sp. TaxID=1974210 RepID=UPI002ACE43B1|nr:IS200/IS605 family transposase [Rhodohalobacter sp.]MDZ7755849.1 IS200/IS605 family transposase [Rhodohalobacter sp.]